MGAAVLFAAGSVFAGSSRATATREETTRNSSPSHLTASDLVLLSGNRVVGRLSADPSARVASDGGPATQTSSTPAEDPTIALGKQAAKHSTRLLGEIKSPLEMGIKSAVKGLDKQKAASESMPKALSRSAEQRARSAAAIALRSAASTR